MLLSVSKGNIAIRGYTPILRMLSGSASARINNFFREWSGARLALH